jgi:hypothetical protein
MRRFAALTIGNGEVMGAAFNWPPYNHVSGHRISYYCLIGTIEPPEESP